MTNLITPGGKNPFAETRDATPITKDEDEPSFSDPEDFVDEVTDEELLGDLLLRDRPRAPERAEASCVVVDHVPQVGAERLDKLKKTMLRIFSQYGTVVSDSYPETAETGVTKGYAFLEYATPAEARQAAASAHGLKLDRQHTFSVATLGDFDRYMTESDSADWEPSEETQSLRDTGDLRHWLLDPDGCDQYSVIYEGGQRTAVFRCNVDGCSAAAASASAGGVEPLALEDRQMWTESYVRWSPRGTYLATFHPSRGVALWGGEKFKQIQRFNHQGVTLADFSPCERYVVTYSQPPPPPGGDAKEEPSPTVVIVWDIRSGLMKRTLQCDGAAHTHWPVLRWSHDGAYVARMSPDALSVYETPSMGLLDKKSMKIVGVKDFSWSPADNVLAFWVPSWDNNTPARVALVQIPSRQEIAARKAFNVVDCKLHWQRDGDYLCVKVDKRPKGTHGVVTSFEIFRTREKLVPVDVVEMKESVVTFALEPNGGRLAVVHAESPGRYSASVYHIKSNGGNVELLKTFATQQANAIFWSPRGQFLVLAGLQGGGMNGQLAFLDTSDCTMMNTGEHYTAGEVEWDPTGRYVVTSVSWWQNKVDTAYWLWSFQGRLLQKNNKERFCQMLWRPRPPTLLSDAEVAAIAKDLKRYSKTFEQKDRLSQSKASKEQVDRRRDAVDKYREYRRRVEQEHGQRDQRDLRLKLRGNVDTDRLGGDNSDCEEETMEFFVGEERIPL